MKKIIVLLVLLLAGCSKEISHEFILYENRYECYAINIMNENIELVEVYYELNDYEDVFNLYTTYQNHLPVGYYVNSSSNIELLDSYSIDKKVYYVVDSYICLIEDIDSLSYLLGETNKLFGYEETFIIFKQ